MQELTRLYTGLFGRQPQQAEALPKAGSNRHYIRFTGDNGRSVIGVIGPDVRENRTFVYLSRHFSGKGLPVPEILAVSDDYTRYLQTDLGHTSLYEALAHGRAAADYDGTEQELLRQTVRLLPHVQIRGAEGLDADRLLPPTRFDERAAMFDLNYFKYCFLRTTDMAYDEMRLEDDLQRLAADLAGTRCGSGKTTALPGETFLYRDFQARNVMLPQKPDGTSAGPHFIDYQGGRIGPLQYDVASFLWQASARYPQTLRESLIEEYTTELHTLCDFDEEAFRERLNLFVLFRILQVLGAYGLRGYFERKRYFIESIPPAVQNLRRQLLDGVCAPYPCLEDTLKRMVDLPQFDEPEKRAMTASVSRHEGKGPLVVRIFSFSYKKGIPEDTSGNGGGYVFDCRSTHNPGRYEPYKPLTGLDMPVIRFLEDDGEILAFLEHVYRLADAHVARYMERGFTDLQFSFGCTGGRHRSVYSAEHLAEHLNKKFGIEIRLCHREQNIVRTLPAGIPAAGNKQ